MADGMTAKEPESEAPNAVRYVVVEEPEVTTERYPSSPPISVIRRIVRDEANDTLRSLEDHMPRRWPTNLAVIVSGAVLVALSLGMPWPSTVAVLASTVALVLLGRRL